LLIRSFDRLGRVHAGFHAPPERVVTMFVSPTGPRLTGKPDALAAFWRQVMERVRALPGVEAASVSNALPPDRPGYHDTYEIQGKPLAPGSHHPSVPMPFVSHDYFRALGIPVLRGRTFDQSDNAGPGVTVISDRMGRLHFPGEDPIGKRIRMEIRSRSWGLWATSNTVVSATRTSPSSISSSRGDGSGTYG
jgi:putative ABC transport system permease protein